MFTADDKDLIGISNLMNILFFFFPSFYLILFSLHSFKTVVHYRLPLSSYLSVMRLVLILTGISWPAVKATPDSVKWRFFKLFFVTREVQWSETELVEYVLSKGAKLNTKSFSLQEVQLLLFVGYYSGHWIRKIISS